MNDPLDDNWLEEVYAALFALITNHPDQALNQLLNQAFQITSRTFRKWDDVPPGDQPALYQRQGSIGGDEPQAFGAPSNALRASWWIYCQYSPDSSTTPVTELNRLISLTTKALLNHGEPQRLGGVAAHAYNQGRILVNEGVLPNDAQSIAVIPITILTGI